MFWLAQKLSLFWIYKSLFSTIFQLNLLRVISGTKGRGNRCWKSPAGTGNSFWKSPSGKGSRPGGGGEQWRIWAWWWRKKYDSNRIETVAWWTGIRTRNGNNVKIFKKNYLEIEKLFFSFSYPKWRKSVHIGQNYLKTRI